MTGANEFKDWFEQFAKFHKTNLCPYGASSGTKPKDIDKWIETLSKNHSELRRRLGGERKEFFLRLGPVEPELSPYDYTVSDAIYAITAALPKYLQTYDLDRNDLFKDKLSKLKNIKTSKHIMGYITRQKITDTGVIARVEKSLAIIGDAHAKATSKDALDAHVVISTEPKAFTLIGHYGCDAGSCFAHGSFNDFKRWCFSIMPNTFVLLLKQCQTDEEKPFVGQSKDQDKPVFRMLGWINEGFTILNACSTSPSYKPTVDQWSFGILKEAVKQISHQVIGAKKMESTTNGVTLAGNVYGHHPSWSFFDVKKHKGGIDPQVLNCAMCDYTK